MNPNTVQVQDCTHTLTEMYGCVYRRICLVTHPLNSARQLPAQLSVFRHRFAKLQKKGLSQTREGIRLVILDQFPWLTQTRSMLGGGETPTACSYWQVLRKHQQKSLQWVVIALLRYPCGTGEKPRLDWNQAQKDIEREFWAFHVIWGYSYIDKAVTVSHWRKEYRSVCGMDFCARQKCNFSCNDPIWLNMDQTFLDIVSFHLSFVCACMRKDRWKVLQQLSEAARRHFVNGVTHSQSQCQHADQAGITVSPILAWMITCEDL